MKIDNTTKLRKVNPYWDAIMREVAALQADLDN